jgi:excisionase family DNA binding protein
MDMGHLTTAQAAERAQVSRPTISRALKYGDLPAIRDNAGKWLIEPDAVDAWAANRASVQPVQRSHTVQEREKPQDDERLNALSRELGEAREALARAEGENAANRERISDLTAQRDRLMTALESRPAGFWARLLGR